jgi:hypothetical protein
VQYLPLLVPTTTDLLVPTTVLDMVIHRYTGVIVEDITAKYRMRLTDILEYLKPRPITQTDAFKAWFSGSKIVDAEGNPLVLYHGTSKDVDFKAFKLPKNGVWFTKDAGSASDYAADNDSQNYRYDGGTFVKTNTASRVIPVYIKSLNPKYYSAYPHELQTADAGESGVGYRKAQGNLWTRLKAEGHDAVIIGNFDVVVVLGGPEQIKSALGNRSFNPLKKNIHEGWGSRTAT